MRGRDCILFYLVIAIAVDGAVAAAAVVASVSSVPSAFSS